MEDWKPGDRVHHPTYGAGTVLEYNDRHTLIHFDQGGRRKFASAMVTLVPSASASPSSPSQRLRIPDPTPRPVEARRRAGAVDDVPADIDHLIALARRKVDSEESLNDFVSVMRGALQGPTHQHVGLLSRMRVQAFQNWLYDRNPTWQLTDAQLLAVLRVEFPLANGEPFTGDVDTGLQHIGSLRADYNRGGDNGSSPISRGMPLSVSYGRF